MATHTEREIDLLRLEAVDLAPEGVVHAVVVLARRPEQLIVARVAPEDRVRKIEPDDRRLREVGVSLVLEPALGGEIAGRGLVDPLAGEDRALRRKVVNHRLAR